MSGHWTEAPRSLAAVDTKKVWGDFVAGMYALSPVFGWLADRVGRMPVILAGQGLLLSSLTLFWLAGDSSTAMTLGLILLGLGWSASVVAGSALIGEAVGLNDRAALQGFSDLSMNAAGALGGALAGLVLGAVGYSGLGLATMVLVGVVVVWSIFRGGHIRSTRKTGTAS